jgi:hypothetical protein
MFMQLFLGAADEGLQTRDRVAQVKAERPPCIHNWCRLSVYQLVASLLRLNWVLGRRQVTVNG